MTQIFDRGSDPFVMYIIVRKDLGMSIGKLAAQCCHAVEALHELNDKAFDNNLNEWKQNNRTKIVLSANESQWKKLKTEAVLYSHIIVTDAGYTELNPNTETVIAFSPVRKSMRPKLLTRLQLLK